METETAGTTGFHPAVERAPLIPFFPDVSRVLWDIGRFSLLTTSDGPVSTLGAWRIALLLDVLPEPGGTVPDDEGAYDGGDRP